MNGLFDFAEPEPLPQWPARARSMDPETSHEAARSLSSSVLTRGRQEILDLLRAEGPLCDAEIWAHFATKEGSPFGTASSCRTRRSELVKAKKVRWTGEKKKPNGGTRNFRVWEAMA